jgi:hypothetical protein
MNSLRLPGQLAFLREWGQARENQHRDASAHGVAGRAADVLRARVHMDDHGLRLAGDHDVDVRSRQGHGLVGQMYATPASASASRKAVLVV